MSIGTNTPPPSATASPVPTWFLVAFLVVFAGLGGAVVYALRKPTPAPVASPIPADTAALMQAEIDALNTVAAAIDAGTLKSDPASLTVAIGQARKPANDKLAADVQQGSVSANLRTIAATMKGLVKGAK